MILGGNMQKNMYPNPTQRVKDFEKKAFGMFIHYGLYSQLGIGEWAQNLRELPMEEYKKLKETFTAKDFDGKKIAKLAKRAGMKYVTLTTRHHDGFSLYDTKGLSEHDVMHSPAKKDLVKEFVEACKEEGIMPILYHTTLDWYQDSYKNNFTEYLEYLRKSIEILCTSYGEIGGFWFDGNWDQPDADWKLDELYGTIRKHQPNALIINNTGLNARGELGHKEIDSVTFEQSKPEPLDRTGMEKYITGEMCQTMNDHWGYAKDDFMYKSPIDFIQNLCLCRKVGANYLLNIGPTGEGEIVKIQEAILEVIGDWLAIHHKPIYEGKISKIKSQGEDFALETEDGKIYLFIFHLNIAGHANVTVGGDGIGPRVFTGIHHKVTSARWLDNMEELTYAHNKEEGIFCVNTTGYKYGVNTVVRVIEIK